MRPSPKASKGYNDFRTCSLLKCRSRLYRVLDHESHLEPEGRRRAWRSRLVARKLPGRGKPGGACLRCLKYAHELSLSARSDRYHTGVPQLAQNFEPGGTGVWQFLQGCGTRECPQLAQNLAPACNWA